MVAVLTQEWVWRDTRNISSICVYSLNVKMWIKNFCLNFLFFWLPVLLVPFLPLKKSLNLIFLYHLFSSMFPRFYLTICLIKKIPQLYTNNPCKVKARGQFSSAKSHITDVLSCFSLYLRSDYSLYCIAQVPNKSNREYCHSKSK